MDRESCITKLLEKKEMLLNRKKELEAIEALKNEKQKGCNVDSLFDDYNFLKSAPQSVMESHNNPANIEAPRSAPSLTNDPNDLLILDDVAEECLNLHINYVNDNQDAILSPSSQISGVEPLSSSPCPDLFSDSSNSWVPNSDEELYVRNHTHNTKILDSTSSSNSEIETELSPANQKQIELPTEAFQLEQTLIISTERQRSNDHDLANTACCSTESNVNYAKEPKSKRWKTKDPSKWKRNVSKRKMHNCLPYENKKGKIMPAKHPKPVICNIKCRYKCTGTFEEGERIKMCEAYWKIQDFSSQKQYLVSKIIPIPIKRFTIGIPEDKRRSVSYGYHFEKYGELQRVCKEFFLRTLCISNGPVNEALKNRDNLGNYVGKDKRGLKTPVNKTDPEAEQQIMDHINSFPRMESHYCRKKSKRQYLDCKLSIVKMYELYVEKMNTEKKKPCSQFIYKRIFGTQFNLSFYSPKKDLCMVCTRYDGSGRSQDLKDEYDAHIARKNECQAAKEMDKERSISDPSYLVVTADMQSTLQIPVSGVGVLYYTRKLNVQNYTIHTAKPPNDAYCILWNETNGKRGSVEIATAINWWITQIPDTVKEITMYSDTCAGQNRNQFIAAFLLHLVQRSDNGLDVFEQKYLESGHTHMEVDSMHSAIEKEQRYSPVYSMIDWKSIMMRARSKRHRNAAPPYNVQELFYNDMLDVRAINEAFVKNTGKDENGAKVMWLKIKCLRFDRKRPGIMQFRYSHEGPYFEIDCITLKQENLHVRTTRKKINTSLAVENNLDRNRDAIISELKQFIIPKAYSSVLPISEAKKKDLIGLCTKGVIPHELHPWFNSLPTSKTAVDKIGAPDADTECFDETVLL